MLKKILNNFSEDELLDFLPKGSIDFSIDLSDTVDDVDSNKSKVVDVVYSSIGVNFVFDPKLRELLIDRAPPECLVKLFPEFSIASGQVESRHYEAVSCWAAENPMEFAGRVGLESDYKIASELEVDLESISRIEPVYSLYPYQKEISDAVLDSLDSGGKRVLIHLPTGAGKTRTAMNIAIEHLRRTPNNLILWLADREELCQQAFGEFKKAWHARGDRACAVYGFYSESNESLGGIDSGFVVASLQKFLGVRHSDSRQLKLLYGELKKKVTLVVFDEAHKSIAKKYIEVIRDFIDSEEFNADLIGLTATPGRKFSENGSSDEDRLLAEFFFNNKITMQVSGYLSPIDYLVKKGYLADAHFKGLNYSCSDISSYELRNSSVTETNKTLASNRERNQRIIDVLLAECGEGAQVIVFACTVKHAQDLSIALNYLGIHSASIDSKSDTPGTRRAKIQAYKHGRLQVLTNYGILTAGFDAPKTSVVLIAKPTSSLVEYLQMAGRAMRGQKSGGNRTCRIYTVMDDIPEFKSVHIAFEYWNRMWIPEGEDK